MITNDNRSLTLEVEREVLSEVIARGLWGGAEAAETHAEAEDGEDHPHQPLGLQP